ncbi:hypothetical protein V8E54_004521 [Elaphomyces granulatus]
MASREPRRSHRPRVLHISSDENELMTSFPISSNLPRTSPSAATTDELSIRGQRPTKAQPNPVRAHEAVTTETQLDPAKDLLPYEPERQQLRMDAVKDFRPYKPERQQHGRSTYSQNTYKDTTYGCPYGTAIWIDPEAVSSMHFAESRNWPPCRSKSNVKIQRERDLLAQLRGRLTESARPSRRGPNRIDSIPWAKSALDQLQH